MHRTPRVTLDGLFYSQKKSKSAFELVRVAKLVVVAVVAAALHSAVGLNIIISCASRTRICIRTRDGGKTINVLFCWSQSLTCSEPPCWLLATFAHAFFWLSHERPAAVLKSGCVQCEPNFAAVESIRQLTKVSPSTSKGRSVLPELVIWA